MSHPRRSGQLPLPARWIAVLLSIKLVWALGYTFYFFHVNPHASDVWGYFAQSRQEADLIHSPADFFHYSFPSLDRWSDLFHYEFWSNLKQNLYVLLLLGMNLITFHNPYADTLLFTLVTFTGWVRFIRLVQAIYPGLGPGWYCLPFLVPTFLFWYSGLHTDGLIFALLGWVAWDAYRLVGPGYQKAEQGPVAVHGAVAAQGAAASKTDRGLRGLRFRLMAVLLLLAGLKAFLFVFVLTLILSWWAFYRLKVNRTLTWCLLAGSGLLILVLTLPEQVYRQHEFLKKFHYEAFKAYPMEGSLPAYLRHFPEALVNGWFRPFPWETARTAYFLAGIELWVLSALCLFSLILSRQRSFFEQTWLYLFAVVCVLVGYTVPVLGAIVRYRSLFFPFVIAFCLLPSLLKVPQIWRKK